jgi:hypothetical protein
MGAKAADIEELSCAAARTRQTKTRVDADQRRRDEMGGREGGNYRVSLLPVNATDAASFFTAGSLEKLAGFQISAVRLN